MAHKTTFKDICSNFGLVNNDGTLMTLSEAFCLIYYAWDKARLQDFMNAIMEAEAGTPQIIGQGESIFDERQNY